MKKILVVLFAVLLTAVFATSVFAAPGSFVNSPSSNKAPVIVHASFSHPDCDAEIVLVPYADRDSLTEETRAALEKAYADISAADDVTSFNETFAKHVADSGIASENVAVSDLFDISIKGCENHSEHAKDGYFTFTLASDTFNNFVALMYFNGSEWVYVEDAKVDEAARSVDLHLNFTTDEICPFAVFVDTTAVVPEPGDNSSMLIWGVVMAVSALSLVVVGVKLKKSFANV